VSGRNHLLADRKICFRVTALISCESCLSMVCLRGETNTRSKRNFHRPQSNCGMALNSGCQVFIVLPRWLRLQIRARRQSTGSVPQTRKKCSNLSFQESVFSSCYFSQAFEDRHFTKVNANVTRPSSNKHRHGKQRSDLAELSRSVMRRMTRLPVM
jgi:hypothetical protein